MALKVVCLTHPGIRRYNEVAHAMAIGIGKCGDTPYVRDVNEPPMRGADAGVCYGWKRRGSFRCYRNFVYADLGFWERGTQYRVSVNDWSPQGYVRAGLPSSRLRALRVAVKPWRSGGRDIIIAGASEKSMLEHGHKYMTWERAAAEAFVGCGYRVTYRPKPTDRGSKPIPGLFYDQRPLDVSLANAHALVTHHSNAAIDALVAGVPVHCEIGAAAAFSVPMASISNAPLMEGREQFLADVAWLQWSLEDMRSGRAWAHFKERGLLC